MPSSASCTRPGSNGKSLSTVMNDAGDCRHKERREQPTQQDLNPQEPSHVRLRSGLPFVRLPELHQRERIFQRKDKRLEAWIISRRLVLRCERRVSVFIRGNDASHAVILPTQKRSDQPQGHHQPNRIARLVSVSDQRLEPSESLFG